jgi:hypothetical protein
VRKHDQPQNPARFRVWLGFILAIWVRGLAAAAEESSSGLEGLNDPIDLAARRIVVWDAPDGRWVYLTGEAAALQEGLLGMRAGSVVVRITQQQTREQAKYFQAEVYGEGDVRLTSDHDASRQRARLVMRTVRDVRMKPYDVGGLKQLAAPPKDLAILARSGFPPPAAAPQQPKVDADAPAELPGDLVAAMAAANAKTPANNRRRDPSVVETQATVESSPQAERPRRDPGVRRAQAEERKDGNTIPKRPAPPVDPNAAPEIDLPPIEEDDRMLGPGDEPEKPKARNNEDLTPRLEALPGAVETEPAPPLRPDDNPLEPLPDDAAPPDDAGQPENAPPPGFRPPITPGTQRVTLIFPRSGRPTDVKSLPPTADGTRTVIYRGGVTIVSKTPNLGTVDIEAESAVLWRKPNPEKGQPTTGPQGELVEDADQPMEVYLEGNVILRQDENKWAGRADQRTYHGTRAYYDFVTDRAVVLDAEADLFAPTLISPMKIKSPRIDQFRSAVRRPDGTLVLDPNPEIRAEKTISTGSRFPDPAYQIYNRSITLSRRTAPATDPNTGKVIKTPDDREVAQEQIWRYDARTNLFYMGRLPVFYWPRFTGEIDDLETPLRMIGFRTNNYFGQQVLTDWNGFKVFGLRRPNWIDIWNIDVDYLSARTKTFPALGSELGWFGSDLIRDVTDPYHKVRNVEQSVTHDYFGYFDIWGLQERGIDVLGTGPAIITNGPAGAGMVGYQRSGVPSFQDIRGRFNIRHMQRFLPDDEEHQYEDLRLQFEAAYSSDRYFIEEYYKRLNDVGMDQETLIQGQWQKNNWAASIWAEANLQNFNTETQWLPRLDYYRLGDSFFGGRLLHYQHTGVDYANTHTDIMVNNHFLFPLTPARDSFAFMPFDPISNTSGVFKAGRGYTSHELDVPINLFDMVKVTPYAQGQIVGWSDQIGGGPFFQQSTGPMGRYWGAAGVHAETTAWKLYPNAENEILNIHGLNNKITFFGDYRTAYSNQRLNNIAVQDDLDDNSYEMVRRYFAITNWTGGILPMPYDPRHLMLRQQLSPITGSTDIQGTIETAQFGIHQRLQTKRGPEGKRRVVDWMTLDAATTYFPNAQRDNFGKPWGQTMYNYQWFLGDRTSILSTGWFDFWNIEGSAPLIGSATVPTFNPKGLNVITTGLSLSRPPRGNIFLGYSVINTGTIQTSALNASLSYWLSPKWYGTFSNSYDFGNKVPLGSMFSFTRIGADYLVSLGLSVDPQRNSYMFAFQISPRLSPMLRLGSGTGLNQFDSRLAPTQ